MHVYARAALGRTGLSGFVVMLKMMQWERILYAPQLHVNEQRCGQSSFTLQSNVMPIIVYTQRCHFCTLTCHSSLFSLLCHLIPSAVLILRTESLVWVISSQLNMYFYCKINAAVFTLFEISNSSLRGSTHSQIKMWQLSYQSLWK